MIEVKKIDYSDYQFIVKSASGNELLKSIPFKSKEEVEETVDKLSSGDRHLRRFERKTNFEGKFLFEVQNDSGKTIASSGLYSSEAGMENGIKNLKNRLLTKKPL